MPWPSGPGPVSNRSPARPPSSYRTEKRGSSTRGSSRGWTPISTLHCYGTHVTTSASLTALRGTSARSRKSKVFFSTLLRGWLGSSPVRRRVAQTATETIPSTQGGAKAPAVAPGFALLPADDWDGHARSALRETPVAAEGFGRRRLGWRTWRSWRGTASCRGKDAGQGDCSPHARGCTPPQPLQQHSRCLFPARAGVGPWASTWRSSRRAVPRTCGGGPGERLLDDPGWVCSPHVRGWTHEDGHPVRLGHLLPASAGASLPGSSALAMRSPRP